MDLSKRLSAGRLVGGTLSAVLIALAAVAALWIAAGVLAMMTIWLFAPWISDFFLRYATKQFHWLTTRVSKMIAIILMAGGVIAFGSGALIFSADTLEAARKERAKQQAQSQPSNLSPQNGNSEAPQFFMIMGNIETSPAPKDGAERGRRNKIVEEFGNNYLRTHGAATAIIPDSLAPVDVINAYLNSIGERWHVLPNPASKGNATFDNIYTFNSSGNPATGLYAPEAEIGHIKGFKFEGPGRAMDLQKAKVKDGIEDVEIKQTPPAKPKGEN